MPERRPLCGADLIAAGFPLSRSLAGRRRPAEGAGAADKWRDNLIGWQESWRAASIQFQRAPNEVAPA